MTLKFILFISYQSWLRYGRRPHYAELSKFGKLFVVEEPIKIISKEFLSRPLEVITNYREFSSGIRADYKYDIKIVRPILLFSAKLKNKYSLLKKIDILLLSLQLKKLSPAGNLFYLLTNRFQEWLVNHKKNKFTVLDVDDEWSMIIYEESRRAKIESDMRRIISKVDIATTVSIALQKKYALDDKVVFLPNAVDINHYVPLFDKSTEKNIEKKIDELDINVNFLKDEKNDIKTHSANLDKMSGMKSPIIGSISGLAGNWSDFAFMIKVEELLPKEYTMVSSGNIHPPTNQAFFEEHENYLKKQRMIYLGFLDYAILPDFLKFLDIGIVMHRMDAFNKHSAPNKIWAYLAMGLPVVSTDFLNDNDKEIYEGLVNFAKTPEEYVGYIVREFKSDNLEKKKKRRELAIRYSTISRAEKLYKLIAEKASNKNRISNGKDLSVPENSYSLKIERQSPSK